MQDVKKHRKCAEDGLRLAKCANHGGRRTQRKLVSQWTCRQRPDGALWRHRRDISSVVLERPRQLQMFKISVPRGIMDPDRNFGRIE